MFTLETRRLRRSVGSRRGAALIATLVVVSSLMCVLYVATSVSTVDVKESRRAVDGVRTQYLAEAGVERGLNFLAQAVKNTSVSDPLRGVNSLFAAAQTFTPYSAEPVMDGAAQVGAYTVTMTRLAQTTSSITVQIDATGYSPDAPMALAPGREISSWRALRTVVEYSLAPSEVFNYGYFINNWGWFYGNTIFCYGNVRSNGQFAVAGYSPTVGGQPLYEGVSMNAGSASLSGYRDDNGDNLLNGGDGGVWSSWDIVGAQNLQGVGGQASNQHEFQDPIEMPNLTDLSIYEAAAIAEGGTITVGGIPVANGVVGDQAGEKQNLYLVGTSANPIVLDGPVVVRGNVIIKGVVTGQGTIYSGGNVYCPDSITYKNAPATPRPTDNTQAATEAWLTSNWNKDFLGLFARENVVIGNFKDPTWQFYEAWWMADPLNASKEDAGLDGIPNTRPGIDGILGTADDDVLEGDGVFTVEHYTAADQSLGLIPPGKNVGDAIPGTGEDIDGDGVYDPQTTLANVILTTPMDTANWAGNMPVGGVADYSTISSMYAGNLDAVFYTNHSVCYTVFGGSPDKINGAVVSRNENIVYGTPSIQINYDARLLGGSSGLAAGWLPVAVQPAEILRWTQLDNDPNRYLVAP